MESIKSCDSYLLFPEIIYYRLQQKALQKNSNNALSHLILYKI